MSNQRSARTTQTCSLSPLQHDPAMKTPKLTRWQSWHIQVSNLLFFIHFHQRFSRRDKGCAAERRVARFLNQLRTKHNQKTLVFLSSEVYQQMIQPNVFAVGLPFEITPSAAWLQQFSSWAKQSESSSVGGYCHPTTNNPYIPSHVGSLQEHLVRKTQSYKYFQPKDCHPQQTFSFRDP